MSEEVVFRREGSLFRPTECATGPWGADRLHGGPVCGLLARAIEAEAQDPALMITRLTLDLFRVVPLAALEVRTEVVRRSARLCLVEASLWASETELVRASAVLLRTSDAGTSGLSPLAAAVPAGPEGIGTQRLSRLPAGAQSRVPPGFHTRVETRWVPRTGGEPLAIWFRLPLLLVEGEQTSPLQRAVALSDFANAVPSIAARERDPSTPPYINVDATLYFMRRPEGEWFCLRDESPAAQGGLSVAEVGLYDARGPIGRVLQARLANRVSG